jgi:hypothetical protein
MDELLPFVSFLISDEQFHIKHEYHLLILLWQLYIHFLFLRFKMFNSRTFSESKILIVSVCHLLAEIDLNHHLELQISNNVLIILL